MEKTLRVLGGGDETGHSHSHAIVPVDAHASAVDTSVSQNGLRSRSKKEDSIVEPMPTNTPNGPSKLSAYLNLFGDFVHNM